MCRRIGGRDRVSDRREVAKAAGFEMKYIVSVTVYLADFKDFAAMNAVYKAVMPDPEPPRTTIQVAGLLNMRESRSRPSLRSEDNAASALVAGGIKCTEAS